MKDDQLNFTFLPVLQRTGPDSFVVKAWKPSRTITVREAAKLAGCSTDTIRRLASCGIIQTERPSPRKTLVLTESFHAYLEARKDPEFWNDERRKAFAAALR